MKLLLAAAVLSSSMLAFSGGTPRANAEHRATGWIAVGAWPYLPGSVLPVRVDGFSPPYRVALVGPGSMSPDGSYSIPPGTPPGAATLLAASPHGLAQATLHIGTPPRSQGAMLAVASYDDGVVFHRANDFSVLGVLAIGGPPGDVAVDADGHAFAPDTQGSALTSIVLSPWSVSSTQGVLVGDQVAIDATTHAAFVTDRDAGGSGALTRVTSDGDVARVPTGQTAEGLAIDERRQIVYVANVNDDSVTAVDARAMRVLRTFHAVPRVFALALSPDGTRLFAVSNETASPPLGQPGSVVVLSLGKTPRIVARSANLEFPVGEALDAARATLFVTDEALDAVYVLDARTLRPRRAPLPTCRTPWKPAFDPVMGRLYVPCARGDAVDVFDARTYKRIAGAPFATGSYPLAVAVWHGAATAK